MILLNPHKHSREYPDDRSREIILETVAFFENRGKKKLKEAYHAAEWYSDFLEFLKEHEIFALVVYGQLILENARIYDIDDDLVDQIFDFMVRDVAKFATALYGKPSSTPAQMEYCLRLIRKPVVDDARYENVWRNHAYALKGWYEMNPGQDVAQQPVAAVS